VADRIISANAIVTAAAGGFQNGADLHGLSLNSPAIDLAGEAAIALQPRRSLTARLTSNHIDLDALHAAIDHQPAEATGQPTASPATAGAAPRPRRGDRIFSDQPIPFERLRALDADLTLTIGTLRSGAADYKAISTHAELAGGKLTIDPLSADLPEGHLAAKLSVDASQAAPLVHVSIHAPGLALKSILVALHEPSVANGNLELYADLSGSGATPHTIAASMAGSLGLAMAGGTIDNRLLGSILGRVMDQINALNLVGRGGVSELRCFGARLNAHQGVATISDLALSSALLTMTGSGSINLGDETLGLTLRPEARIGGTPLVVPINVTGPIRAPVTSVSASGAANSNAGPVAGALLGNATSLGALGGLLGVDRAAGSDICPAALAAARGQAVPAAAPTKPAEPNLSNPKLPNAGAVLRNLFR
jgi:uncharacterized protein involved in outer membrane biogenesis